MSLLVLNIEDESLIPSLKRILGAIKGVTICKPQKDSFRVDPYEISPSGDTFFADSRNVKAVEEDIAKAHQPGAKFTRLENKEDITAFINSLTNANEQSASHKTDGTAKFAGKMVDDQNERLEAALARFHGEWGGDKDPIEIGRELRG